MKTRTPRNPPRPGEIQFKHWLSNEAARMGITEKAFAQRYYRGQIPQPPMRRVNRSVVFVVGNGGEA